MSSLISRSPLTRILFPFVLGTLPVLSGWSGCRPLMCFALGLAVFILCLLFRASLSGRVARSVSLILSSLVISVLCGMGIAEISRKSDPELQAASMVFIAGEVSGIPGPRAAYSDFETRVRLICCGDMERSLHTTIRVYLPETGQAPRPGPGESWVFYGRLQAIENQGNPGEVDFAGISHRRDCWYALFVDTTCLPRRIEARKLRPSAARLRNSLSLSWQEDERISGLLMALCLGDKSRLDADLRESFSRAGAMHVLAVSGLHVGMIWWVLHHLLAFSLRLGKREFPRTLTIVIVLWAYAALTGFSSSVSRAVCMFSLFSLAKLNGRRVDSINVVLLSMFLLLWIQPARIFDAGFQLSYSAVLSILAFHRLFMRKIKVRNRILRWIVEATLVSVSAQLGTFPLILYHFQAFPAYGLISNLLTLPLLSCIMALFVLSLPLGFLPLLSGISGSVLIFLGKAMEGAVGMVAALPRAMHAAPPSDGLTCLLGLLFLTSFYGLLKTRRPGRLLIFMLLCALLMFRTTQHLHSLRSQRYVQISRIRGGSLVTFVDGLEADHYIWCSDGRIVNRMDSYIQRAWSPALYEHSVCMPMGWDRGMEAATYQGSISICSLVARGTWLLGNDAVSFIVLCGKHEARKMSCPELDISFILLSHSPDMRASLFGAACMEGIPVISDASCGYWYRQGERLDKAIRIDY